MNDVKVSESTGATSKPPAPLALIGPHVSRLHAKGKRATMTAHIKAATREAKSEGFAITAAALFVGGPRTKTINLKTAERSELAAHVDDTGIVIIAHSSYVAVPWGGDPTAAKYMAEELDVCGEAKIAGLVTHLPTNRPASSVARFLPKILGLTTSTTRLYLEAPAQKPEKSQYETVDKLVAMFREIRAKVDPELKRVGLCIDTAHLWASGVNIASYADAESWLNELEAARDVIPPELIIFHLNDNRHALGSGRDEHEVLGAGEIWKPYASRPRESGLAAFTDYMRRHSSVGILERKPPADLLRDYRVLLELVTD